MQQWGEGGGVGENPPTFPKMIIPLAFSPICYCSKYCVSDFLQRKNRNHFNTVSYADLRDESTVVPSLLRSYFPLPWVLDLILVINLLFNEM